MPHEILPNEEYRRRLREQEIRDRYIEKLPEIVELLKRMDASWASISDHNQVRAIITYAEGKNDE